MHILFAATQAGLTGAIGTGTGLLVVDFAVIGFLVTGFLVVGFAVTGFLVAGLAVGFEVTGFVMLGCNVPATVNVVLSRNINTDPLLKSIPPKRIS